MPNDDRVLLDGQRRVLEQIAEGQPLKAVLATLCRAIEGVSDAARCSILLLDQDGVHIRNGAAPSLPAAYSSAIDGVPIGPVGGSCGTAMYRRTRVVVEDIASDPLWAPYRALALPHGLCACASIPIIAGPERRVLGSFAIYHDRKGPFSERELRLLESLTDLAAVAIVNHLREQALRDSESQRSRTEAFSLVMVAETSLDGAWLKVPPTLCAMLGRAERELLGARVDGHTHPEDVGREASALARLVSGEVRSIDLEKRFVRADGEEVWAYVNTSIVCDEHGTPLHLLSFIRDLTDKKRAEEMLRRTQKAEGLAVLAGGIAHDFNNLLAAMGANATLLGRIVRYDADAAEVVRTLEGLVKQAASFTQQLLAYTGKARVEVRSHDLGALVGNVVHLISASVSKNIELRFEHGEGVPPVEADAAQIQQVALNLITNASEAIGEGPGTIRVRTGSVVLSQADIAERFLGQDVRPGEHALLEVSDTGAGMTAETAARIFEPFFTTKFSGRGLGLAATRGILESHHGAFELDTSPGRGARFRLYFPASPGAARTGTTSAPPPEVRTRTFRILLVDDEEGVRQAMSKLLECLGHRVITAEDGRQALKALEERAGDVDVVIMDVTMPGIDGVEAARRIEARWPGMPIVLTSGYAEASVPIESACVTFLQKPYSLDEIEQVLERRVRRRTQRAAG